MNRTFVESDQFQLEICVELCYSVRIARGRLMTIDRRDTFVLLYLSWTLCDTYLRVVFGSSFPSINADGSPPSLCVVHRLITTRTCSNIVIRASKYHKLARFLLIVDTLDRSLYIDTFSQILGNESAAYSLALKKYHRSLLSEHGQGFEHTRCSVINFVPEPIYYNCK